MFRAPPTRVGRQRTVTYPTIETLYDRLLEKPGLYIDKVEIFLWDEFRVQVTNSSLKRALALVGWWLDREQRNRMRICEISTYITCQTFSRITWFTWTSLGVINELGSDGQAGLRKARHHCR
jgi:hypothetical protein